MERSHQTDHRIERHRKPLIDRAVRQFRCDFGLKAPMVDCVEIAIRINQNPDKYNIRVKSSLELRPSILAHTIYIKAYDLYYVIVNRSQFVDGKGRVKYPYQKSSDCAVNFTLAHEFGHIYLEHAHLTNIHKSSDDILKEDLEADEFAGQLLMPERAIMRTNFQDAGEVARTFNVSLSALRVRLTYLNALDLLNSSGVPACECCGNTSIDPEGRFCSICSDPLPSAKGVLCMNYDDGFLLNENGRVLVCPRCMNAVLNAYDSKCAICGMPLYNRCTNPNCSVGVIHDGSARFCTVCGAATTFYQSGALLPWKTAMYAMYDLETVEDDALGAGRTITISTDDWSNFVCSLKPQKKLLSTLLMHSSVRYKRGRLLIIFRRNVDKYRFLARSGYMKLLTERFTDFFDLPLKKVNSASFEEFLPMEFQEHT